jgi:hypothetical protein
LNDFSSGDLPFPALSVFTYKGYQPKWKNHSKKIRGRKVSPLNLMTASLSSRIDPVAMDPDLAPLQHKIDHILHPELIF